MCCLACRTRASTSMLRAARPSPSTRRCGPCIWTVSASRRCSNTCWAAARWCARTVTPSASRSKANACSTSIRAACSTFIWAATTRCCARSAAWWTAACPWRMRPGGVPPGMLPLALRFLPAPSPSPACSRWALTMADVFAAMRDTRGKVCLDLGCGTGDFLLQWVLQSPDARGVGVDMSADALRQARETALRWGVADRLSFHEAAVGPSPLAVPPGALDGVEMVTSMYMLHQFGRDGREAIVDVVRALKAQLPGRHFLALEVEACDPQEFAAQTPPPAHFGRLDYRLIHQLSGQGLPRGQEDWHGIFSDAGCSIVKPGKPTGGSLIYIAGM